MREVPPSSLVALLERLGLATAAQIHRVGWQVRRLASDLPRFDSVWVDALAQARVLTPLQAAEINAGRGEALRVGPYLLCQRLAWPEYAAAYQARRFDSRETVRLLVLEGTGERAAELLRRLECLAAATARCPSGHVAPLKQIGRDGDRLWAAWPWTPGRSAAEWLVHNGRLPADVVLEVARSMAAGLAALEQAGICHGDVTTAGLLLSDTGEVALLQPGIRGLARPEEGYACADLRPQSYDYLAPERVADGTPPTAASDIFACGCVWWHLLCGRPPLAGGDSLAKLRAAQAAQVVDVRRFAPEVPAALAAALSACVQREPSQRPESFARLAATLGPPTRGGAAALAKCLAGSGRRTRRWAVSLRTFRQSSLTPMRLACAAACLVAAAAFLWPMWQRQGTGDRGQGAGTKGPAAATGDQGRRPEGEVRSAKYEEESRVGGGATASPALGDKPAVAANTLLDKPAVAANTASAAPLSALRPPPSSSDLVLPCGDPLDGQSLRFRAGQRVCGVPGKRPLILVPRGGLLVEADDICFDNVDFVSDHPAAAGELPETPGALIHLCCARARFRGCLFQSLPTTPLPPVAIRWNRPADGRDAAISLPSSKLQLDNCVLHRVEAGVDCHLLGAVALELANTLDLGSGPLVRLDHCPRSDEPLLISASQVTLRGAGPLLLCRCAQSEHEAGEISIQAAGCVFAPANGFPLLLFDGGSPPEQLLANLRWAGQGSLVTPATVVAAWRQPGGALQTIDDASVSIAGLVRSEVGFADELQSTVAASRIIRWRAPLQSPDPPGIDPQSLPEISPEAALGKRGAGHSPARD